jgi:ubiquinone/menaquinone biosynthesis C-methylase UbiE/uncharacterized protein YbaR (Trm112 family)
MAGINLVEKIKVLYENGGNIIQFLRESDKRTTNTIEDILISYDFQAGSYVAEYYSDRDRKDAYSKALAAVINGLGTFDSILEAGVGEATTLGAMLPHLTVHPSDVFGFDLSWSRIFYGSDFLRKLGLDETVLFTGDLFEIPLADSSVDVVYTSHAIEPNGGKEREALLELFRVTRQYLVLLEPAFEFAMPEGQERVKRLGYVTELFKTVGKLGMSLVEHRPFEHISNPLNPTGLMVIKKETDAQPINRPKLACPVTKRPLARYGNEAMYSRESLLAYPVLRGIPCLLRQNAILAAHFLNDGEGRK